jgi:hypothetical protein
MAETVRGAVVDALPEQRKPAAVPPEFRLRYIAMQAAEFTAILDELHRRYAELETDDVLPLRAVVEQAAAAAHDLAVSAHGAADALSERLRRAHW